MLWHNVMFSYDKLFERAALMLDVDVTIRSDDRPTFGVVASTTPPTLIHSMLAYINKANMYSDMEKFHV